MTDTVESLDAQIAELTARRDVLVEKRDADAVTLHSILADEDVIFALRWDARPDAEKDRFRRAAARLLRVPVREPRLFKKAHEVPVGVVVKTNFGNGMTAAKLADGTGKFYEVIGGDRVTDFDGPFQEVLEGE